MGVKITETHGGRYLLHRLYLPRDLFHKTREGEGRFTGVLGKFLNADDNKLTVLQLIYIVSACSSHALYSQKQYCVPQVHGL